MVLLLKPTTIDDYDEYYKIRCSPADIYWNGYESKPDKNQFKDLFKTRLGDAPFEKAEDRRLFLIQVRTENKLYNVGFLQLIKRIDGIDIGYSIIEGHQRKGYATKALLQGIKMAFDFDKNIYVQIRDDNIASQGVAKKCGFVRTDDYVVNFYPCVGNVKLRKYVYPFPQPDNL